LKPLSAVAAAAGSLFLLQAVSADTSAKADKRNSTFFIPFIL
jgi:hypothetical protein